MLVTNDITRKRRQHARLRHGNNAGGGISPIFFAPLTTSLVPARNAGSGTPTFSRASTAYVRGHENIERQVLTGEARFWGARRIANLLATSGDMTTASWNASGITRTGGQTDSQGGATACLLTADGAASAHSLNCATMATTPVIGNVRVIAADFKAGTTDLVQLTPSGTWVVGVPYVNFNLTTGAVTSFGGTGSSANGIISLGNGWYRCWMAVTATAAVAGLGIIVIFIPDAASTRNPSFATSATLLVGRPQNEDVTGQSVLTPSEYVSTGVLSSPWFGANVDGVCYKDTVRLHTQNLLTYSEDQSNAAWTKGGNVSCASQDSVVFGGVGNFGVDRLLAAAQMSLLYGRANRTFRYVVSLPPAEKWTDPSVVITVYDSYLGTSATGSPQSGAYTTITLTGTWPTAAGAGNSSLIIFSNKASTVSERLRAYAQDTTGNNIVNSYNSTTSAVNLGTDTGSTSLIPDATLGGIFREAGATNLCLQSQTFDSGTWSKDVDLAVTADNVAAPDGTLTADTCTEGVAGTARIRQFTIPVAAGGLYSWSVYARRTSAVQWLNVALSDDAADVTGVRAWFDLTNGVVGNITAFGTGTAGSIYIEPLANGWYRLYGNGTIDAGSTVARLTTHSCTANGNTTRVNNAVYALWGAQVELSTGALGASSYIPTVAATVTRSADALTYAPTGNFSVTFGAVYGEYKFFPRTPTNSIIFGLGGFGASPQSYGGTRTFTAYDSVNSTTVSGTLAMFTSYKGAVSYGNSVMRAARAGGSATGVFNNTFGGTPTTMGQNTCYGLTKNLRCYGAQLSDAQLDAMVA